MLWFVLIIIFLICLFVWIRRKLNYWKKKGVIQYTPESYLESLLITRSKSQAETFRDSYLKSPDVRYIGVYQTVVPFLLIKDPELIKIIAVKESESFLNRRQFAREDSFWRKTLLGSIGHRWKKLRHLLSPAFTSSKIKTMFVLMDECAKQLSDFLINEDGNVIEVGLKDLSTRYANDVIATTAFGLKCNSFKYKNNELYLNGKNAAILGLITLLRITANVTSPFIAKIFQIGFFPKEVYDYFKSVIGETVKAREEKQIFRPDLIQLMIETRKGGIKSDDKSSNGNESFASTTNSAETADNEGMRLSIEDMAAQAFVMFMAGFETVSTAIFFFTYELAINPDIQERLQREVDEVLHEHEGVVNYEALLGMKYMDMVISEVLRKWPSNPSTDREASRRFTIEPVLPGEKAVTLEKGEVCLFPILGIHWDPKYYPNPETFDPERFNEEKKKKIVPYTYLPFGVGPRNCIGSRLALLEVKLIIFYILKDFSIVPTEKSQIPIKLDKKHFFLATEGEMYLGFERR